MHREVDALEYVKLGRAGVKVSRLCLGCLNFGWVTDEAESIRIIHRALDAGINFIDTANVYSRGLSEEIVGEALAGRRDQVILATKFSRPVGDGPNDRGNSRWHIMREVEGSLRRLKTDYIDLYQVHRPDPDTPLDETLSALTDLVRQGKVRYIGTSTFPAWQLCESLWISERMGYERFVCEQPPYNILNRGIERELLPFAQKHGFAIIPWSPLAAGWLSGKYRRGEAPPPDSRAVRRNWDLESELSAKRFAVVEQLEGLAKEIGRTISQLALNWLLQQPAVTAPIIGPRTMEQLEDNLAAFGWSLAPEHLEFIDRLVPPGTEIHPMY
ncbi:MAG: aldo/keto reductase [Firmicutes bacterium ZCTH02-B6]|nr:MAG: aldo/keto reductase [Firmicutes bacterium ZCTH02-B6]